MVQFGPLEDDNFIQNKTTGDKIMLRKKEGSYIMDVSFGTGREWAEITVDSAAEESECPQEWGGQYGMGAVGQKMNLVNASGGKIDHYGQREVVVKTSTSFCTRAHFIKRVVRPLLDGNMVEGGMVMGVGNVMEVDEVDELGEVDEGMGGQAQGYEAVR